MEAREVKGIGNRETDCPVASDSRELQHNQGTDIIVLARWHGAGDV
jgi:hypothetical protein